MFSKISKEFAGNPNHFLLYHKRHSLLGIQPKIIKLYPSGNSPCSSSSNSDSESQFLPPMKEENDSSARSCEKTYFNKTRDSLILAKEKRKGREMSMFSSVETFNVPHSNDSCKDDIIIDLPKRSKNLFVRNKKKSMTSSSENSLLNIKASETNGLKFYPKHCLKNIFKKEGMNNNKGIGKKVHSVNFKPLMKIDSGNSISVSGENTQSLENSKDSMEFQSSFAGVSSKKKSKDNEIKGGNDKENNNILMLINNEKILREKQDNESVKNDE